MTIAIVREEGFAFAFDPGACGHCQGNCCRGASGNIWVNPLEIQQISFYLKTNVIDFIAGNLVKKNNRYSLRERRQEDNFECIFFSRQHSNCSIYPVRPGQCRSFPFWDRFKTNPKEPFHECPGIVRPIE